MSRKIYLASSWRNADQEILVRMLREWGHEVYDFKNPKPGNTGFAWSQLDVNWKTWTPEQYASILWNHPVAADGFNLDKEALDWCDACVLLLPCGKSAHLEAGYAAGQGKPVIFLLSEMGFEPELMYRLGTATVCTVNELYHALKKLEDLARNEHPA